MNRADFNINYDGVRASGYVTGTVTPVYTGDVLTAFDFRPEKVVLEKFFSKSLPDFKELERKAIEDCVLQIGG